MPTPAINRDAILAAIREHGPMTAAEIAETTGKKRSAIDSALVAMRKRGSFYVRVSGYRRQIGGAGIAAGIFALGPGKDVPREDLGGKEGHRQRNERYREKNRMVIRAKTAIRRGVTLNPFSQLINR